MFSTVGFKSQCLKLGNAKALSIFSTFVVFIIYCSITFTLKTAVTRLYTWYRKYIKGILYKVDLDLDLLEKADPILNPLYKLKTYF